VTITHHELCFGCGLANLFGLQLEVEPAEGGRVEGRFFVKQDHQGPPGYAHGGIVSTALDEAMALLVHHRSTLAFTRRLEVDLLAPLPVGSFGHVNAWIEGEDGRTLRLAAELRGDGDEVLARARGVFVSASSGGGETA
jgi:acyl-coenzyme A thioesterase PaaI-like protein